MRRIVLSWSIGVAAAMIGWLAMAWASEPPPSSPPSDVPTARKPTPLEELAASQPAEKPHRKKPTTKPPAAQGARMPAPPYRIGLNNGSNKPVAFTSKEGITGWSIAIPGNQLVATPAVVDGKIFIGGGFTSRDFGALDARTGDLLWYYSATDNGPTAPVVASNYVTFNTESCELEVLNTSGQSLWKRRIGDPLTSTPAIGGGRLITSCPAGNGAHFVVAYDLRSGNPLWQTRVSNEIIVTPVIDDTKVYFATVDGALYCLVAKTGAILWSEPGVNATSTPTIWNGGCWFSRRQEIASAGRGGATVRQTEQIAVRGLDASSNVRALSATTRLADYLDARKNLVAMGALRPTGPMSPMPPPPARSAARRAAPAHAVPGGEIVQVVDESESTEPSVSNYTPVARQPNAGFLSAQTNLGALGTPDIWAYQGSRPLFYKNRLYAAMGDSLACIDPKTEKVLWKKEFRPEQTVASMSTRSPDGQRPLLSTAITPPALVNDKVFIGTSYGELTCLSAATGEFLWQATIGDSIVTQPVVAHGRIYVVTKSGRLFCLDSDDRDDHGWLMWGGNAAHTGTAGEDD